MLLLASFPYTAQYVTESSEEYDTKRAHI